MDVNVIIDEPPCDTSVDHPSKEKIPLPPDKKFHIFFSYRDTQRDKLWVKRVIDKLEIEYGYTCFFTRHKNNGQYKRWREELRKGSRSILKRSLEKRKNIVIPVLLDDCAVPEEYMLLTYIDARDGVEETTWWPKLLKSLESTEKSTMPPFHVEENNVAVDKTFAVNHLCSIETKYNYRRRCIQANSKYLPAELQPEAIGVPVDIIRRTYKDLLQSPSVLCRQKCWLFAIICISLGVLGYGTLLILFVVSVTTCIESPNCTFAAPFYFWVGFFIVFPVFCIFGWEMCYLKNPSSVYKNVIEHNTILSKYGVFVTVVHRQMWGSASLIFYTCKFELCKEYVIRHLAKEETTDTTEYTDIPHSGQMVAPVDDLQLLSGITEPSRSRESKALNMLLSCTPEYFTLAYAKKLKNPKEDRHGIEVLCLCQYLEKVDKEFRKKVKTMQTSNIDENYENNKHLKKILLY